jgi:hypothetical protein
MKRDRRGRYHHKRKKSTISQKKNSLGGGSRAVDLSDPQGAVGINGSILLIRICSSAVVGPKGTAYTAGSYPRNQKADSEAPTTHGEKEKEAAMISIEVFLFGLANALIGYLVGNWLTTERDRRKEFNALIDPVRSSLLCEKDRPGGFKSPDKITLLKIRESLPFWKRKGFERAVEAYKQSKSTYNRNRKPDGGGSFMDGEKSAEDRVIISHAANDLLRYLKPR